MFKAYTGIKPYLFLSYAHKDAERIFPLMERLQKEGCNVWYDEGIHPADEWGDTLAKKIVDSKAVLLFISQNSIDSFNVKREIYYAVSKNVAIIPFYLEDVVLPDGLDLQLGIFQAIRSQNNEYIDCINLKNAFPKEVITGVEPSLIYQSGRCSYYFIQHSKCGFKIYEYDHEKGKERTLFKNEQPQHLEIESSVKCYSVRYTYGDDFYSLENGTGAANSHAVLFSVFCDHVSDRVVARFYLDYSFALINPNGQAELKILELKEKRYDKEDSEIKTYKEELPISWRNQN